MVNDNDDSNKYLRPCHATETVSSIFLINEEIIWSELLVGVAIFTYFLFPHNSKNIAVFCNMSRISTIN